MPFFVFLLISIPLFTALLSAAILGDPPKLFHGIAFALIAIGILASSTNPSYLLKKPV
jgi:drug/metabolite transporter (DMT)-like permease